MEDFAYMQILIVLFLGHNFRTTNARKSAKGSKDSGFRQVSFTTTKLSTPCNFLSLDDIIRKSRDPGHFFHRDAWPIITSKTTIAASAGVERFAFEDMF